MTIEELQEQLHAARERHGPTRTITHKMKLLRTSQIINENADEATNAVGLTVHALFQDIHDLWCLRMKGETADFVLAEQDELAIALNRLAALVEDVTWANRKKTKDGS